MRTFLLAVSLLAAACTDDEPCLEGVCTDVAETRALPGACQVATNWSVARCDVTYAGDRPSSATCYAYDGLYDGPEPQPRDFIQWTYDAAGAPSEYKRTSTHDVTTWTFGPTEVRVTVDGHEEARYDRALFAFRPGGGMRTLYPGADLGLVHDQYGSYTWSREGSQLIRTNSEGARVVYELDAQGRLLSQGKNAYTYDGDRVATSTDGANTFEYIYDRGGNLSEMRGSLGYLEAYSYACW